MKINKKIDGKMEQNREWNQGWKDTFYISWDIILFYPKDVIEIVKIQRTWIVYKRDKTESIWQIYVSVRNKKNIYWIAMINLRQC